MTNFPFFTTLPKNGQNHNLKFKKNAGDEGRLD